MPAAFAPSLARAMRSAADSGVAFCIDRYAEIGLRIHDPRPDARYRLLVASSQSDPH